MQQLVYREIPLREHNFQIAESFGKNHAFYVHHTYKDVDCLQNGSVHELYCLQACQISKVQARSHKITNESCTSSDYENTKLMATDVVACISAASSARQATDVEEVKNFRKQNFEDEANNKKVDKEDTQ